MYGKAVNFYMDQVRKHPSLKKDLVELLIRMKNYDKAETILKSACSGTVPNSDSEELMNRCQLLLLLAKVQQKTGNSTGTLHALTEAKEIQGKVLKRLHVRIQFNFTLHCKLKNSYLGRWHWKTCQPENCRC